MLYSKKLLKVAMTGANGFVGRNVRKLFEKQGIEVIGIVRKDKAPSITFGTTIISHDLSEKYLASRLKGCSVLLHLIGRGKQTIDSDYEKINVCLTKNAVNLCKKAGIKKIIYISGLGVHKNTTFGYFISKYKAEQEIITSGLDYTIFRASYIIGKGDPLSQTLSKQIKNGTIIIAGSGNYRLQPIFVEDVAQVFLHAAMNKKLSNKIIDLVGPKIIIYNCFVRDFLRGKKVKIKKISLEDAYRSALHNPKSVFGIDDLNILIGDYVGNHKILQKISGIKFKTHNEVLKASSLS
ncbi:MAG TPA: NAD(P)H-binding protein [Nitrosopumilaceae archaeon]|nr:NAD(P)H-binding protein [Nitrosopumilaceae archaeon]